MKKNKIKYIYVNNAANSKIRMEMTLKKKKTAKKKTTAKMKLISKIKIT